MGDSADFVIEGDELRVAPWEWTCALPPVGVRDVTDADLLGMPVTVRRGYEWTRVEDGGIVSGPPVGVAFGFGSGWFLVLDGLPDGCRVERVPFVGACPADAGGGPCMWFRAADCRAGVDADELLAFVRDVAGREASDG